MKKAIIYILFSLLPTINLCAQEVMLFKQHNMKRWDIPAGNYSGITHIEGDRYALVSDKQEADGWTEVNISFLPSGDIEKMQFIAQHFNAQSVGKARDAEGIVYVPHEGFFVGAENDQQILAFSEDGKPTGVGLPVPTSFGPANIYSNYGFESLTSNRKTGIIWTTTEQGLITDVPKPSSPSFPQPTLLRILSFDFNRRFLNQYAYKTEPPVTNGSSRHYAFGVSEMLSLNDTTLLVMERELNIPANYNRSRCNIRIYSMNPEKSSPINDFSTPLSGMDNASFLAKNLVCAFKTGFSIFGKKNLANYEGMCLGPELPDGKQTILLVSDSQSRAGNAFFHLKDYIRVIVVSN
jgi:hypothetical protein